MRRDILTAAILAAAITAPTAAYATHRYSDVPDNHPHAPAIHWAQQERIADGYNDGTYRPDQPVNRAQMATFLRNLSGTNPDVPPAVNAATLNGKTPDDLTQTPRLRTSHHYGPSWVECPAGTILTGGGYRTMHDSTVIDSWPHGNRWNTETNGGPTTAYAVCAWIE